MTSKLLSTRLGSTNAYFSIRTCVHFKELLGVRMCVQTFFWACLPLKLTPIYFHEKYPFWNICYTYDTNQIYSEIYFLNIFLKYIS